MPHAWPSAGGGDEGAGECPSLIRLITPSTLRHHLTPPGPRGHVTASLHTHVLTESRERTRPCPSHWSCAPGPGPRPPSSDPSANAVDSEAPSAQVRAEFPCDSSTHTCCPADRPPDLSRHSHWCERHTAPAGWRSPGEPAAGSVLHSPLPPRAGGTHGWSERVSGVALATQAVGTSPMLGGPESLRAKI